MRRQLIVVFAAVSSMVAIAFVVPLAFLVRNTAADRAIDEARADAAAIVPALVSGATRSQVESAAGATLSGREGRMTVLTSAGWTIGADVERTERLAKALASGLSSIGSVEGGGSEVITAVATGPDELSAIRVFVPESQLRRGQSLAWWALGGVAVTLVGLSVFVADRLARSIVRPTQQLAVAAQRLGDGDLAIRVEPEGPPELVELADAFNSLGSEVSSMLDRERELVAELSHRLRTPLTKLRMRVDQVSDEALALELRHDVSDVTLAVNALIGEARRSLANEVGSCDAAIVVRERVEFWSVLAEDTERPWSFTGETTSAIVPVSAGALEAAVDVLIENVFTHTAEGVRFDVGLRSGGGNRAVRIWVGDAGDGFDQSATERGVSGLGSTGLGLDIARTTAESAGGSLEVGPSELGGTEVAMVLPAVTPGQSEQ